MSGVLLAGLALIPARRIRARGGAPDRDPDASACAPLGRARVRGDRTPLPVSDPATRRPGAAPTPARARPQLPLSGGGPAALDGVDLDLGPGRRVAVVARAAPASRRSPGCCCGSSPTREGLSRSTTIELSELAGEDCRRVVGLVCQDAHIFDNTLEENLRMAAREATSRSSGGRWSPFGCSTGSTGYPQGMATELGERGGGCPADSASAWVSHGPCSQTSRCCPRRARRASGHADGRRDTRRPAGADARARDAADHPPARGPGRDRRSAGARPRPCARARHTRRAARTGRPLRRPVVAGEPLEPAGPEPGPGCGGRHPRGRLGVRVPGPAAPAPETGNARRTSPGRAGRAAGRSTATIVMTVSA